MIFFPHKGWARHSFTLKKKVLKAIRSVNKTEIANSSHCYFHLFTYKGQATGISPAYRTLPAALLRNSDLAEGEVDLKMRKVHTFKGISLTSSSVNCTQRGVPVTAISLHQVLTFCPRQQQKSRIIRLQAYGKSRHKPGFHVHLYTHTGSL